MCTGHGGSDRLSPHGPLDLCLEHGRSVHSVVIQRANSTNRVCEEEDTRSHDEYGEVKLRRSERQAAVGQQHGRQLVAHGLWCGH